MVSVSVCGIIELKDGEMETVFDQCAHDLDLGDDLKVERHDNPFELIEQASSRKTEELVDLVVCGDDLKGMSALQVLSDLRPQTHGDKTRPWRSRGVALPRFILTQRDAALAYDAALLEADGFLVIPATTAEFSKCLMRCLEAVVAEHRDSTVLRCQDGWQRVLNSHVLYSQTSNHNQVIHLDDGTEQTTRATSQELFGKLSAGKSLFFKAGSSYIVNMGHIESMRPSGNVVILSDGTSISVPSRTRTALERELLASC